MEITASVICHSNDTALVFVQAGRPCSNLLLQHFFKLLNFSKYILSPSKFMDLTIRASTWCSLVLFLYFAPIQFSFFLQEWFPFLTLFSFFVCSIFHCHLPARRPMNRFPIPAETSCGLATQSLYPLAALLTIGQCVRTCWEVVLLSFDLPQKKEVSP